jgi:hypothetical protein
MSTPFNGLLGAEVGLDRAFPEVNERKALRRTWPVASRSGTDLPGSMLGSEKGRRAGEERDGLLQNLGDEAHRATGVRSDTLPLPSGHRQVSRGAGRSTNLDTAAQGGCSRSAVMRAVIEVGSVLLARPPRGCPVQWFRAGATRAYPVPADGNCLAEPGNRYQNWTTLAFDPVRS